MGRHPKPTAIKKLAGNPGKRPLNELEPEPELVLPPAPADLNPDGKAKWEETASKLYNQGILTELDIDLLYLFCVNYQDYLGATKAVAALGGPVVKSASGNPFQNPYLSIANQCQERMIRIMSLMGMSPADRSKVKMSPRAKPESLAEKFFGAPVAAGQAAPAARKTRTRKTQPARQPAEPASQAGDG